MQDTDNPYQAQAVQPAAPNGLPPETMVINGVTYRRESDVVDRLSNAIERYKAVAERTGVSLRQAVWFNEGDATKPMPD